MLGKPYPYDIVPIEQKTFNAASKAGNVAEFFRIEFLLRSPTVMKLYEDTYGSYSPRNRRTDAFFIAYGGFAGWEALRGVHHALLDVERFLRQGTRRVHPKLGVVTVVPSMGGTLMFLHSKEIGPGVMDVRRLLRRGSRDAVKMDEIKQLVLTSMMKDDHFVWLRIDSTRAPHATLQHIKKVLMVRHKAAIKVEPQPETASKRLNVTQPQRPLWKAFPIKSIKTWVDYLKCYDLHRCKGLSYGQIALQVYGTSKSLDLAKKACRRVQLQIDAAEQKQWPPRQ